VTPGSNPGTPTRKELYKPCDNKGRAKLTCVIYQSKVPKKFIKNKENFICEKCGFSVVGDGYTNHCSECLYSKHVDVNPGDRASVCQGLMKPLRIEGSTGDYKILHKCLTCGFQKVNKLADADNMDTVVAIINENSKKFLGRIRATR
jgi:hypothetical protein